MHTLFYGLVVVLVALVVLLCYRPSSYGHPVTSNGEAFANPAVKPLEKEDKDAPLMEYPPNGPSPAEVYTDHPYHLLADILPSGSETLSDVTSRSCYATDFEQATNKTGNFRQLTNNVKRAYPDSCSGWNQELTLSMYSPLSS